MESNLTTQSQPLPNTKDNYPYLTSNRVNKNHQWLPTGVRDWNEELTSLYNSMSQCTSGRCRTLNLFTSDTSSCSQQPWQRCLEVGDWLTESTESDLSMPPLLTSLIFRSARTSASRWIMSPKHCSFIGSCLQTAKSVYSFIASNNLIPRCSSRFISWLVSRECRDWPTKSLTQGFPGASLGDYRLRSYALERR